MKNGFIAKFGFLVEHALLFIIRVMLLLIIFFFGISLICYSFTGQPPWISSLAILSGFLLIILGSNFGHNDFP